MLLKLICLREPDISYTRNKELVKGETYWGKYQETDIGSFGKCHSYDVFDKNEVKKGHYFAIDFLTVAEYRDKILSDLLK